jgi:hypothetical protein
VSEFDQMDLRKMEDLTHDLKEMGFVVMSDLLSEAEMGPAEPSPMDVATTAKGIARVFANSEYGCYATLVSVIAMIRFPPEQNRPPLMEMAPFRTVICSLSGNEDDSWAFATHNREMQPFSLLHRHPRMLSHRLVGADAQELLKSHLAEREGIATRGGFQWERATSLDAYMKYEERAIRHIRSVYENASTLPTAWKLMTLPFQNQERWMGELG